jgi:hypothetical protein
MVYVSEHDPKFRVDTFSHYNSRPSENLGRPAISCVKEKPASRRVIKGWLRF